MADTLAVLLGAFLFFIVVKYVVLGGPTSTSRTPRTAAVAQRSRPAYPVSPEKVDTVLAMFPAFPRATIQQDLARTGSVEQTCENILTGALVPPPAPIRPSSVSQTPASGSKDGSRYAAKLNLGSEPLVEPAKVWEQTPEGREQNLRARKEFMLQQARQ
ncbi:hypothetical protein HDU89_006022 [Geranomyces variabilis]|nr:hypothetical protein HDU89_006022 [Geranomyces variabilis]